MDTSSASSPLSAPPQLILVLGDQLSLQLSSLRAADRSRDVIVMAELAEEATYVRHHKKKIALVFSAMRHFADELRALGWQVDYSTYDPQASHTSFRALLTDAIARHHPSRICVTEPGEHRLRTECDTWADLFALPVDILDDDRFLCSRAEFTRWAQGRKSLRMEYFYREMRRKTGLLMVGDQPVGGRWNFDADNRKPAPTGVRVEPPLRFPPDSITQDVLACVADAFEDHFGRLDPFWFGVTRADADTAFDDFVANRLPYYGDYQDAMVTDQPFLYHAVVSIYLNLGLLDPLAMCRDVEAAYHAGAIPLNAAEGFIRQVIGWREFVRGIYWHQGPTYGRQNALGATRNLPAFYWTGETDMACLRESISQTWDEAYAHHIQRLMVTGNFALLAGIDPHQVHEWYLAVYADAFEWVELPNTMGMSQFADGGVLGSKPYAASGNYIHKMSNYCGACRYKVKQKTGPDACPFNPLYWDFLLRHETEFRRNPRMAQMYRVWDRMAPETQSAYRDTARHFLASL